MDILHEIGTYSTFICFNLLTVSSLVPLIIEKYLEKRCLFAAISDFTPAMKTGLVLLMVILVMMFEFKNVVYFYFL